MDGQLSQLSKLIIHAGCNCGKCRASVKESPWCTPVYWRSDSGFVIDQVDNYSHKVRRKLPLTGCYHSVCWPFVVEILKGKHRLTVTLAVNGKRIKLSRPIYQLITSSTVIQIYQIQHKWKIFMYHQVIKYKLPSWRNTVGLLSIQPSIPRFRNLGKYGNYRLHFEFRHHMLTVFRHFGAALQQHEFNFNIRQLEFKSLIFISILLGSITWWCTWFDRVPHMGRGTHRNDPALMAGRPISGFNNRLFSCPH